jgi:TolB-like protein/DNA-binding SARP family transcriptional activator/Flp pilus assembly protein TadD
MAVTELTLFGSFGVRSPDNGAIESLGQKERALLAFLALSPGKGHSRETLASLLWGDRGDLQARDSLKHALTRLRRSLQHAASPPIITDRQSVRLDPAAVTTDVAAFERLLREGTPEAVEKALELYRGDLLEGISVRDSSFEEWLRAQRQRLRQLLEETLAKLLALAIAAHEGERATRTTRRLLSLDPLHEAASRALMQAHAASGETVQALKLYEGLRDRLERELRVTPEPETTRLYEAIRQRRTEQGAPKQIADTGAKPEPLPFPIPGSDATTSPPLPDKPSIAVLPFKNLSGDPEQQYFSDGITEDILLELSRFRSLFIIARNSSFAFDSKSLKVQDIARELGVAYIVEGSVRRAGERVRINAQLVDAATGNHLWAERYDRDMSDIFSLQDEVARSVASRVSGRVEAAGRERVERLSPTALRAYDLVLRAKALTLKYTRAYNAEALACAERAVQLGPGSARAHAHAAWCHFYNYMACWTADREHAFAKAYELAQRAVELDETDSFARIMLGIVQIFRREYKEAEAEVLKAIELNPSDAVARRYYAMFLAATGQAEAGIEQIELGRRLNPFDTRWVPWDKGIVCFTARRYEEAIAALRQARDPINEVRGWLAASYAHAGRLEEARATLKEFLRVAETDMAVFPGRQIKDWEPYWHGAFEYRDQKEFDHLFEALRKAGLGE